MTARSGMRVRLLAIDIDDTLLDRRGRVPRANVVAIEAALDRGVDVTLVTGRSYPYARPVLDQLPEPLALIVSNGALVKTRDGVTEVSRLLPRESARRILEGTRPHREHAALVFDRLDEGHIVTEGMDWDHPNRRGYYERNRGRIDHGRPLESALTEDPVQLMFNGSLETMRTVTATLQELPPSVRFQLLITEYAGRDFTLIDILAEGCTKGSALAAWAEARGVPARQVMAIGDNFNDREMLEYAGVPVVMANAVDPLKANGWHLTTSNDEAGVAAAIEAFVLS